MYDSLDLPLTRQGSIKTIHITNAYHPHSGGIASYYRALMQLADQQGRSMCLIVPGERSYVEEIGEHGRIYYVKSPHAPFFDRTYRMMLPHRYLFGRYSLINKILVEEQPDLVEICDKYAVSYVAGLIRSKRMNGFKRPVLVGLSCERMDDNLAAHCFHDRQNEPGRKFARFFMSQIYVPMFDYHIANSTYTSEELKEANNPENAKEIFVCPGGVDRQSFSTSWKSMVSRLELNAMVGANSRSKLLL